VGKVIAKIKKTGNSDRTNLQNQIIRASAIEKIYVNAGPGTGKTYSLLKRLEYLVNDEGIDVEDIIVLSFSRAAINEIKSRLENETEKNEFGYNVLHSIEIKTFDSFATYLLKEVYSELNLSGKNYNERIELAIKCIDENPHLFSHTQHIIVDEIQDLVGVRARFVRAILGYSSSGFTLLGDMCQSIYDYQVKDIQQEMSSKDFITWLLYFFESEIKTFELDTNYRQTNELALVSKKLRITMLNQGEEKQKEILISTINKTESLGDFRSISKKHKFKAEKKYGVLFRNNGQVLLASKVLNELGVHHSVQKPSTYNAINKWLGEVIWQHGKRYINRDDFINVSKKLYPLDIENLEARWLLLKKLDNNDRSRVDLENIRHSLGYMNSLFADVDPKREPNIILSSIHRAKGREYDIVILNENDILDCERWEDISDEVRVGYVALTRAKEKVLRTEINSNWLWVKKINDKRWVATGYNFKKKKKYLKEIEIGIDGDINVESYVSKKVHGNKEKVINLQKYICKEISTGDPLTLKKVVMRKNIEYQIFHRDKCIGTMSKDFVFDLFEALREVQNFYSADDPKFYPNEITGLMVGDICTFYQSPSSLNSSDIISDFGVWNGIYFSGFGTFKW
jgi:DNA helicase II / ATP-dependent DNA helicase PcrA